MSVVKSLRSANVISYVSFINNTPGSVSIYWHNFEGELVKYDDIKPGESYSAKTFTEHPWSAKDTATGYKVLTDNRYVFYPRPNPSVHERISIERPPDFGISKDTTAVVQSWDTKACPPWIRRKLGK